jgi:hypothetical protein
MKIGILKQIIPNHYIPVVNKSGLVRNELFITLREVDEYFTLILCKHGLVNAYYVDVDCAKTINV